MLSALAALALTAADAGASSLEPLADALAAQVVAAHPEPPVALAVSADAAEQARTVASLLAARL
ncbi:MAG: VCBS repeat-containing protein, partial [Myxococcaceae bacterium]|nr:VCBS repeat-containing protein [Myxococcaceae bacterium]